MKKTLIIFSMVLVIVSCNSEYTSPKKMYRKANKLNEEKKFQESLLTLNQLILIDSAFIKSYYLRSHVYKNLKDYKNAIIDLEHYLKLNNKDASAYLELPSLRYSLAATKFDVGNMNIMSTEDINLKNILDCINDIDNALRIDSLRAEAYYMKGGELEFLLHNDSLMKNYSQDSIIKEIFTLYSSAIKLKPKRGEFYYSRANIYLLTGDTLLACKDLRKGAKLRDKNCKNQLNHIINK